MSKNKPAIHYRPSSGHTSDTDFPLAGGFSWIGVVRIVPLSKPKQTIVTLWADDEQIVTELFLDEKNFLVLRVGDGQIAVEPTASHLFLDRPVVIAIHASPTGDNRLHLEVDIDKVLVGTAIGQADLQRKVKRLALSNPGDATGAEFFLGEHLVTSGKMSDEDKRNMRDYFRRQWFES